MEPRTGSCDAATTNSVNDPTEPIAVEAIELELIDRGLDEAVCGELVDARALLEQLLDGGSNGETTR